jgi:hypothetical protein
MEYRLRDELFTSHSMIIYRSGILSNRFLKMIAMARIVSIAIFIRYYRSSIMVTITIYD